MWLIELYLTVSAILPLDIAKLTLSYLLISELQFTLKQGIVQSVFADNTANCLPNLTVLSWSFFGADWRTKAKCATLVKWARSWDLQLGGRSMQVWKWIARKHKRNGGLAYGVQTIKIDSVVRSECTTAGLYLRSCEDPRILPQEKNWVFASSKFTLSTPIIGYKTCGEKEPLPLFWRLPEANSFDNCSYCHGATSYLFLGTSQEHPNRFCKDQQVKQVFVCWIHNVVWGDVNEDELILFDNSV